MRYLVRVDIKGVADFRAGQGLAGFFVVEVFECDVGIAFDAAFEGFAGIIQLGEMADEQIRVRSDFLFADASVATGVVGHGSFDSLFVHLDDVAGELGAASEVQVDFRSEADFVGEGEVFWLFPISRRFCAGFRNGVAENFNLFLGDVGAQFFRNDLVHFIGEDRCCILLSDQGHGRFSFPESRIRGVLAVVVEDFLNAGFVVRRFDGYGQSSSELVDGVAIDLHRRCKKAWGMTLAFADGLCSSVFGSCFPNGAGGGTRTHTPRGTGS